MVGLVVPPRTVGSFAMTRHWVCATSASATTTPPPTGSSVCSPASGQSSSTGVPGSTSASTRSRTIILPRARCRSTYCAPPPASTSSCSARTSSASARMAAALSRNSVGCAAAQAVPGAACSRAPSVVPGGPALLQEGRPCPRPPRRRRTARPSAAPPRLEAVVPATLRAGRAAGPSWRGPRPAPPGGWRSSASATQSSSAAVGLDRGRESPAAAASRGAEALAGERHAGEEAAVHDAQRRHQDHRRRHADADLGEGERARPGGHGHVGRGDQPEAAGPRVAVDPGDHRHRALARSS